MLKDQKCVKFITGWLEIVHLVMDLYIAAETDA